MEESMKTSSLGLALLASVVAWSQETTPAETTSATPSATASLNPDISVIGNVLGVVAGSDASDAEHHIQLHELELVFGARIYPGIRGDAVIALHDPEFSAEVEEGYVTFEQFSPRAPIGGRLGIVRLPFGKTNPVHPHQLPYADTPSVIANLLGDEFIGNGFEVIGLVPTPKSFFLQGQLGRWAPRAHHHDEETTGEADHDHELGAGFHDTFTLGRLWTSTSLPGDAELELGVSGAFGKGEHEETDDQGAVIAIHHPEIRLLGGDVTWRKWLSGERRLLLQGEAIHREEKHEDGTHRQFGYFLLGTYRPSHFYELGTRYDWSEAPGHEAEHESYLSAFVTRFLNETTFTRLQVKHGTNVEGKTVNEVSLQLVFGFGPHAHVLQ
jgi:hypothetical protein